MLHVKHLTPNNPTIVSSNGPNSWGGKHLPTIQRKVRPIILEHTGTECKIVAGMIDD